MKIIKLLISFIVGIVLIIGCATTPPVAQDMPSKAAGSKPELPSDMPDWFINNPEDDDTYFYAAGSGASRKMEIAISKAKQVASVTISERISAQVSSMVKQFTQEAGMTENTQITEFYQSTSKTVTNNTLHGLTVLKKYPYQKKDNSWNVYVLVGLKKEMINSALVNVIKNEEALYSEFKASQAFEDLEATIK